MSNRVLVSVVPEMICDDDIDRGFLFLYNSILHGAFPMLKSHFSLSKSFNALSISKIIHMPSFYFNSSSFPLRF
jgi:hypothetical protein